jgi:hypothetical protein
MSVPRRSVRHRATVDAHGEAVGICVREVAARGRAPLPPPDPAQGAVLGRRAVASFAAVRPQPLALGMIARAGRDTATVRHTRRETTADRFWSAALHGEGACGTGGGAVMRVAIYVHVRDAEVDGPAAVAQEAACRAEAARRGWTVVRADRDRWDTDWLQVRPALRHALDAIGRGEADALLVDDPARLGDALLPTVRGRLVADDGRLLVVGRPPWPAHDAGEEGVDEVPLETSYAQREAIRRASIFLTDSLFLDLASVGRAGWSLDDSYFDACLPRRYRLHYSPDFLRRFFVCVAVASWNLAQAEPGPVACLAEALAVRAIVETARMLLELEGRTLDFEAVEHEVLEDTDFEYLFDPAQDGVEDSPFGRLAGMEPLGIAHWFAAYGDGTRGDVHPYAADPAN